MVNPISVPNFHEDLPSPLEQGLATSIGNRNPMGAAAMLMAEQNRRGQAQDDYHGYLAGVNDLQQQNMRAGMAENAGKLFEGVLAHPTPGALEALQGSPLFSSLIPAPGSTGQLSRSIQAAADATNTHNQGLGVGGFGAAGVTLPPSMLPPGSMQNAPAVVQAQDVANRGRIGAALASANKIPPDKIVTSTGNPVLPTLHTHYLRPGESDAPSGLGGMIPAAPGTQGAADQILHGGLPGMAGNGGATAQPDPTAPPSQSAIDAHVATLPPAARDQVQRATAANGGKPVIGMRTDGQGRQFKAIIGADGKAY